LNENFDYDDLAELAAFFEKWRTFKEAREAFESERRKLADGMAIEIHDDDEPDWHQRYLNMLQERDEALSEKHTLAAENARLRDLMSKTLLQPVRDAISRNENGILDTLKKHIERRELIPGIKAVRMQFKDLGLREAKEIYESIRDATG
jgi:hypothetical protein